MFNIAIKTTSMNQILIESATSGSAVTTFCLGHRGPGRHTVIHAGHWAAQDTFYWPSIRDTNRQL